MPNNGYLVGQRLRRHDHRRRDEPFTTEIQRTPSWIAENTNASEWIANVVSLNGDLAITVDQNGTPTYQYSNLHGDIMGTAAAGATSRQSVLIMTNCNAPVGAARAATGGSVVRNVVATVGGLMLMGARLYAPAPVAFSRSIQSRRIQAP